MSLSKKAFKAVIKAKGWTIRGVAARWGISDTWLHAIAANEKRASHYDDAIFGLPSKTNSARQEKRRLSKVGRLIQSDSLYCKGEILSAMEDIGSMASVGQRCIITDIRHTNKETQYKISFDGVSDWFTEDLVKKMFAQTGIYL